MDTLRLALVCLKVGTFTFGGGMSMIPMMEQDVVGRYHWLSEREFWDAVALGQMTPGPLLVSATFIGYKVGGPSVAGRLFSATVATFCIFLPSCLMTLLVAYQLSHLRENPYVKAFLRGVSPGVVGLLLSVAVKFGQKTLWPRQGFDPVAALLAVLALLFLIGPRLLGQAGFISARGPGALTGRILAKLQKVDAVHVILAAGLIGWWVYR